MARKKSYQRACRFESSCKSSYGYNAPTAKKAAKAPPKQSWWDKNKGRIVHRAISIGVGFGAGLAAVAICAGTAGIGCAIIAGAAVGVLVGTPAHLIADKAMGHETSGGEAAKYLVGSAVGGGFQGGFRQIMGAGPLGVGVQGVRQMAPVVGRGLVHGGKAVGHAAYRALEATGRAQTRGYGTWN